MPDELSAEADPRSIDDILTSQIMYPDMAQGTPVGVPLPRPRPTDLPMQPQPEEAFRPDLLAQANVAEYFANRGNRGTAAGAQAAPAQLLPDEQRRSGNVEIGSQAMQGEVPNNFYPDVSGISEDLIRNPHSAEYIRGVLKDLHEGAQGQAINAGNHPLLSNKSAANSRLAKQAGMDALKEMMAGQSNIKGMSDVLNIMQAGNYDAAIAQAQGLLDDYNAP